MVQLTPPGSECSIIIGNGITSAVPGSVEGLQPVVEDIEAAHAELIDDRINQRVEVDKDDAETVAAEFLSEQGQN